MNNKVKEIISLIAGLLLGFIFIASGTGKLFGDMETPAQAMAFINAMLPEALLTPLFMQFIYKILVPIIFPWAELILGLALLIGLMPRLAAVFALPMVAAFMGTNIWTIMAGEHSQCANCFGMWERFFGSLTPYQSLSIDIVLALLCLCVIFLQPGRFLTSRWPFSRLLGKFLPERHSREAMPSMPQAINIRAITMDSVDSFLIYIRNHAWSVAGYILGIAGIILIILTAAISASTGSNNAGSMGSQVTLTDNITISDLTTSTAMINFVTKSNEAVDIILYNKDGKTTGLFSDLNAVTNHSIKLDNLYPATTYYFQLLWGDFTGGKRISGKHSFTTLEPPPVIINVSIAATTDSAARITWETDRPTTSEVTYWEEGTTASTTISDNISDTMHEVMLQLLDRERVYAFVILARDAYGHQLIAEYEGILSLKTGAQLTQRAPDISLPAVAGGTLELSQYRGKVVLLVFWSMTCPTCQKKMPLLQRAYEREDANQIAIITVHAPGREAAIQSYCSSQGLTLPVALDLQGNVGSAYNVLLLPSAFVLDQSHVIRYMNPEFNTQEELDGLLHQFLSK